MFGKLNEQAASALLSLEPGDLSYCLKLAKRFEHMGIESDQASNALCTLVESGELETIPGGVSVCRATSKLSSVRDVARMICSVSSASCGRLLVLFVFPM